MLLSMFWNYIGLPFLFFINNISEGRNIQRHCARTYSSSAYMSFDDDPESFHGESDATNSEIEICKIGYNYCYTLWEDKINNNNVSSMVILAQGCWESGDSCSSVNVGCQADANSLRARKNTRFCCCSTDLCNTNVTVSDSKPLVHHLSPAPSTRSRGGWERSVVAGGILGIAGIIVCIAVFVVRRVSPVENIKLRRDPNPSYSLNQSANNNYSMSLLTLDKIIGQGRYGTVWLGTVREEQVAVKMYSMHYSQYFYNEKDIYSLPFMQHPNLLTYFGCDEYLNKEGVASYVLVVSYCPMGTLQDYLKNNVMDLSIFATMSLSITAGLSHLHTEIRKADKWKPCISHRDVNSKNILVKNDLTCCLCDMGLAVKITGSRYYTLGEEQHAQTKSINDVGTLRYMAPEVLEGAVNLRDCESSLKQIDVYALGLVLWEMAMRTVDFYSRPSDVQPYTLPYQHEVGLQPTLEAMQNVVCRNKIKVGWPKEWKTSGGRLVRETVEDCTDQDGEARLTALCVHERLSAVRGGRASPLVGSPTHLNRFHPQESKEETEGVSEGTCETILTLSPTETQAPPSHLTLYANRLIEAHQGRNPCLERNLLASTDSSEELCIIQASCKDSKSLETQALIRPAPKHNPIPYLQNRPFSGTQHHHGSEKKKPLTHIIGKPLKNILKKKDSHSPPLILSKEKEKSMERPSSLELEPRKPLKELSCRVKTPGDLPPSVRKKRARFSLYDDRIMSSTSGSPTSYPLPLRPFDSSF